MGVNVKLFQKRYFQEVTSDTKQQNHRTVLNQLQVFDSLIEKEQPIEQEMGGEHRRGDRNQNRFLFLIFWKLICKNSYNVNLVMMHSPESCKCFREKTSVQIKNWLSRREPSKYSKVQSFQIPWIFFTIKFEAFFKICSRTYSPHLSGPKTFSLQC